MTTWPQQHSWRTTKPHLLTMSFLKVVKRCIYWQLPSPNRNCLELRLTCTEGITPPSHGLDLDGHFPNKQLALQQLLATSFAKASFASSLETEKGSCINILCISKTEPLARKLKATQWPEHLLSLPLLGHPLATSCYSQALKHQKILDHTHLVPKVGQARNLCV